MSSIFTDLILERNRIDTRLMEEANTSLRDNIPSSAGADRIVQTEAALRCILDRFDVTPEPVRHCDSIGELMDCVLDPLCIMYEPCDLREADWRRKTVHMLGFLEDGTAVALFPTVGGYRYVCPSTGRKGRVTKNTALDPTAYVIYRPLPEGRLSLPRFFRLLFALLSPADYVPVAAAIGVITLLGLVAPSLNRRVLNQLVPLGSAAFPKLISAAVLFVSVGVLRAALTVVKTLMLNTVRRNVSIQVQAAVVSRILFLPDAYFKNLSAGKLSRRIQNSRALAEKLTGMVMDTSVTAVFSLVYIPQMARFAPSLYIPALLILAAQLALSIFASAVYAKNTLASNELSMEENGFVYAAVRGIQKLKTSGAVKRVYAKWAELYRRRLVYNLDPPGIVKLRSQLIAFISSFGTVLILSVAIPSGVTRPDYIAFTASYGLIVTAATELMTVIDNLFSLQSLLNNLKPLFEAEPEQTRSQEYVKELSGRVQLENIHFAYEGARAECLKGVSLSVRKGEKVAIVGESGCGKSTLLRILMGMEAPSAGCVYYDGRPLPSLNKRSLRRHIGSVFQFSQVMPGSIQANIAFGAPDITEDEIWDAAKKAQIEELIRSLPLGMDTEISESRGGGFSGGQKQCILLARAFAGKPSLLVLDEATSALDNVTQKKVLDAITALRATVIMVAHRLSTVKDCDRIIMLSDGVIAEQGTYEELIEKNGLFAELVRKQLQAEA